MNKLKIIGIFVILIILTVCIVFLPQLMSEQNEEKLLGKKLYWNYNVHDGTKMTSNQVAELYYNREVGISVYNDVSLDIDNYDPSLMQQKSFELFETVFKNDKSICEHIKKIVSNGTPHYSQSSPLIKIDHQPIALIFIDVVITSINDTFWVKSEWTRYLDRSSQPGDKGSKRIVPLCEGITAEDLPLESTRHGGRTRRLLANGYA